MDLLKEYYYLRAKADAEFIVYFAAKTIEKGSTAAAMAAASAAGAGLLSISAKYAGNIADNALSHSKADLERLGKVNV